jgi:hypothetical protein
LDKVLRLQGQNGSKHFILIVDKRLLGIHDRADRHRKSTTLVNFDGGHANIRDIRLRGQDLNVKTATNGH